MVKGKKTGLGKGIDSLIPQISATGQGAKSEASTVKKVERMLKLTDIEPNCEQPRRDFNEDRLDELADSIKQVGVIQPIIVQKKDNYYEIIAGERRWRAAKKAGLKEMPAIVKDYTEQEIIEIALIENIQREDLNPIEEAMAYRKLLNEFNLKQDEVAEKVSKSRTAVTNTMRLLKLSEEVQQMLIDEMISSGHARALLAIDDPKQQYNLAIKVFDEKLNVRDTEKLVKLLMNPMKKEEPIRIENEMMYRQDYLLDIEDKIKRVVGTKVKVNSKANGKGKIEIEYFSDDELERLLGLFMSVQCEKQF